MSMDTTITAGDEVTEAPQPQPPARLNTGEGRPGLLGRALPVVAAAVLGVLAWQLISLASGGWVPSAMDIATAVGDSLQTQALWADVVTTFRRIAVVLVGSTVLGFLIGLLSGLSRTVNAFFRPLLVTGLAIPDPLYIIIAILIIGTTETSGLLAVTIAITPIVANVVLTSVEARDRGLDEMARVYGLSWPDYLRHVVGGQIMPAVGAALRTAFAFSWKLIVLMEALTQPDGIGGHIYYAFRLLRPAEMVAYALIFMVVMKLIEAVLLLPVSRATAWSATTRS